MKILANPIFMHGAVVLFCASFAFLLGMMFMRLLRKSIQEEADLSSDSPAMEALPLNVYNTVIRQLKQQQDELKVQTRVEQQKTRASENFNQAVLANLSCGVLSVGKNGLVKSSNPAAKQILGFASPVGMSLKDIFREAAIEKESSEGPASGVALEPVPVAEQFESVMRSAETRRDIGAAYETPSGEPRDLSITVVPMRGPDGTVNGAACLIDDVSELRKLRREAETQDLREPSPGKTASAGRAASAGV